MRTFCKALLQPGPRWLGLALAALLAWGPALAQELPDDEADAVILRRGQVLDARPALHGPAFYLKGDGLPELGSFNDFTHKVAATPIDVVVLGSSYFDYDGECKLLSTLEQVNSCTTVLLRRPEGASSPAVLEALKHAEVIYFRGGNQCNLVAWRDTPIQEAVVQLVARGGGTGGGSAGLAIQGALAVYDGCKGSARSPLALAAPYGATVSFAPSLFDWEPLDATLTDSHFVKRDRMGRLMTFLCRQLASGKRDDAWGLGIDEGSAIVIDREGLGSVYGDVAYMVHADRSSSGCEGEAEGQVASAEVPRPITYLGFKVWRLPVGSTYDFYDRPADGYYKIDVVGGVLSANPYTAPVPSSANDGVTVSSSNSPPN